MSMATLQFYKNPYVYPNYGSITAVGSSMQCTPVGTGLKTGSIKVAGDMADFMNCNYLRLVRNGSTIYAWVEDVAFHTANSFTVSYSVDAWRTYRSKVTLGTQYIDRSNTVTSQPDNMLGSTNPTPEISTQVHSIGNGAKRVFVVQTRNPGAAAFTRSPVQPTPYRFHFIEYSVNDWLSTTPLFNLMVAVSGAQPELVVTMYSVPWFDTSTLPIQDMYIKSGEDPISGFRFMSDNIAPNTLLTNEADITIGEDMAILRRRNHSVQLVLPEAGIMDIPDELLMKSSLRLRQDIDLFSGAVNYMLVSGTAEYYTNSVRGSSISSIPVVSDPLDTYLSQNQNALATSLIGDVASIGAGLAGAAMAPGVGTAIGAGSAAQGINNIINRTAQQNDMKNKFSNPPAFLGTALASNFNGVFWTVVSKQRVDNATHVNGNYGYPYQMVAPLSFPSSGYIKTEGCSVTSDGTVPKWAIEEINTMFNNGVAVH